jgi:hypothetical protein
MNVPEDTSQAARHVLLSEAWTTGPKTPRITNEGIAKLSLLIQRVAGWGNKKGVWGLRSIGVRRIAFKAIFRRDEGMLSGVIIIWENL